MNGRAKVTIALRALVWDAVEHMQMSDVPEPRLRPGWVVLNVKAAGICGSEIAGFLGKNELRKPPLVMGHEFSGIVTETGEAVPSEWMGRTVAVNPVTSCEVCRYCRTGNRHLCPERKIIGVNTPGAFADKVAVPVSNCVLVKDALSGALVEPLATGFRSIERSGVDTGDSAAVFGAGLIGLSSAKFLRAKGAVDCVVVDTIQSRLEWALKWGATLTINASKENVAAKLKELCPGGFDCIVDAAGAEQTRNLSIGAVRRGGRVVFVGLHENMTKIPGNDIVRNETEIVGSFGYSDDNFRRTAALAEHGMFDLSGGWLDVRPLSSGQDAFVEQAKGPGTYSKIILQP